MEHKGRPPVNADEPSRVSDSAANSTSHVLSQQTGDKSIVTMHPEQVLNSSELAAKTNIQAGNEISLEKTESNSQNADVHSAPHQKPGLKHFVDNFASNLVKPFASNKRVQGGPGERARQGAPKQASKRPGQEFYDLEVITFPENTSPQVDVVAVYDFADGTQLRRRSKDPVVDDADRGKQQPLLPKSQAADEGRNSIDRTGTRSKSGPLTDAKYLEKEQDADLSLSRLHTRREPSNEDMLASQVRQDPSLIDTTHSTEKQEQTHEHQRSRLSDVGTWSSRQSSEVRNVDWGRDAKLLRSEIPNARILAYPYRSLKSDDSSTPTDYLTDVARHLILQLANKRTAEEYSTVPIIFVGHDFGCLILQKMIALLNSFDETEANNNSKILGLTAGTIFLDALPHPLGREIQSKDGVSDQETYWMIEHSSSGRETFINAKKVWKDFLYITESKMIPVVCFHVETTQLLGQDPPGAFYKASRHKIKLYRRSSRKDPDYQNLIDQVKGCLAFKLSSDVLLAKNLSHLFKEQKIPESKETTGDKRLFIGLL